MAKAKPAVLAVVADPHIGNHRAYGGEMRAGLNERGRQSVEVLRRALRAARAAKATHFLVAGDLFHSMRPEPAEIVAVQRAFAEEASDLGVVIVPGNHDMLDATAEGGNTACEPLWREATVCRKPEWYQFGDTHVLCVPFFAGETMANYLERVLRDPLRPAGSKILVTHVGVYDDNSPAWTREARDAIHANHLLDLMVESQISHAFVGNYHNPAHWAGGFPCITQIGTLCPGGYGDAGFQDRGRVSLYRSGVAWDDFVPGPRFFIRDGNEPLPDPGENWLYVRQVGGDITPPASPRALYHWERVEPEAPAVGRPALPAAVDADAALVEYVGAMPPMEGVTAAEVLARVRDIWKRS